MVKMGFWAEKNLRRWKRERRARKEGRERKKKLEEPVIKDAVFR